MTIAQRYGLFTVVPGVILMLIIGVVLTGSDSGSSQPDGATLLPYASIALEDESIEPVEQQASDSQVVVAPTKNYDKRQATLQRYSDAEKQKRYPRGELISPKTDQARALNDKAPESASLVKQDRALPISKEAITQAFQELKPAVKACYEELLEDFPKASGKLSMNFVFEAEGDVSRLQTAEFTDKTTLFDRQLHDCVAQSMSTIELPKMQDGGRLAVTYPFDFRADAAE